MSMYPHLFSIVELCILSTKDLLYRNKIIQTNNNEILMKYSKAMQN